MLRDHIAIYFASTEAARVNAIREMEEAERKGTRVVASSALPLEEWNPKWPTPARIDPRPLAHQARNLDSARDRLA
jgi:hypothetical protein